TWPKTNRLPKPPPLLRLLARKPLRPPPPPRPLRRRSKDAEPARRLMRRPFLPSSFKLDGSDAAPRGPWKPRTPIRGQPAQYPLQAGRSDRGRLPLLALADAIQVRSAGLRRRAENA